MNILEDSLSIETKIETLRDLENLRGFLSSFREINSQIIWEHEKEHYDMGVELGYQLYFTGCYQLIDGCMKRFIYAKVSSDYEIPLEDKLKIASAPTVLSEGDKKVIRELKKQIFLNKLFRLFKLK